MAFDEILNGIREGLDAKDRRREEVFTLAREIRRTSTKAVREIHKENYEGATGLIKEAKKAVEKLEKRDWKFNFLTDAVQEYCEAVLTHAFIMKEEPPSPEQLKTSPEAYILGLADAIGELRRFILDEIRKDSYGDIEYFLDLMDELYHDIIAFDYPAAILPIRRKQDAARLILERTRGDVTMALKQSGLEKKLEGG